MIAHIKHSGQENRTRLSSMRVALLVGTALAGFVFALPAHAQQVWEGGTSTDWFDAANWSAAVPGAADDVSIAITGAPFMPVIDGATAVGDDVFLGDGGAPAGTLTILNGGLLNSSGVGGIGMVAGSDYSVLVTETSRWLNATSIIVGEAGTGSLTISDGGGVVNALSIIGNTTSGIGTVTVDGPGSTWFTTGAAGIFIGEQGMGSLTISNGGAVTNDVSHIGNSAGSTGTVTVDGAGSIWTNTSEIVVGDGGSGSLTISDGGSVNNTFARIGNLATGSGAVTVTGPGSSWTNSSFMVVGDDGDGSLMISNGAAVSSNGGIIGDEPTGIGTVTIDGAGSSWTNSAFTAIGEDGDGSLTISDGGSLTNTFARIGTFATGSGAVTVTGPGSSWTNANNLDVGIDGTGSLTISNGATVSNATGSIGDAPIGTGTVTVDGAGSSWTNANNLFVGNEGMGSLTISNGATVSSNGAIIGDDATGNGRVTIDGPGSSWTTATNLVIGRNGGMGSLTVSNGGFVDLAGGGGPLFIAENAGSEGVVNIGTGVFGGGPATGTGSILADAIIFGPGTGTLVFNHTDSAYTFAPDITGPGFILHAAGVTSYTGDGSGFTGTTEISGGTLYVNNLLGGSVNVTGGMLGGVGALDTVAINSGGTIAPGNSIGTLNIANITINPGSTYEVEVNSAGQSDLINATFATINGGAVQVVPFPDFALGTTYTIVTAGGGVTGTFDSASLGAGSLFITPTLTYDATNVFVSLAQTATFTSVAMTPNQIAAAGGAQSLGGGELFNAIALLGTADEANAAFDAVSGEIHASAGTALLEDSRFPREAAMERLRAALGGVAADGDAQLESGVSGGSGIWGQGFGSWRQWGSDGNAAALDRTIGGFLLGADALVTDNARFGVLGGYSRSGFNVPDRMSSGTADTYTLGAYGGGEWDAFTLTGGVAHSWHSLDISRSVAFSGFSDSLDASYHGRTLQAWGEAAVSFESGAARFEPFANLAYVHLSTDGFTETGGAAALTVAPNVVHASFTTLGLRAETEAPLGDMDATLHGMVGWRHAFGGTPTAQMNFASGGDSFTIAGVPLAQDSLVLDAGIDVDLTDTATLGLSYGGQFGSGVQDHSGKASFNVRF